jgi:hypothetical protein
VLTAIAATGFLRLVPALHATRIEPARTLRGELIKDARPGRARNLLIGVQVFASALLLICSAIFLRSAIASSRFSPGFRTADTLVDRRHQGRQARRHAAGAWQRTHGESRSRSQAAACWHGHPAHLATLARGRSRSRTSTSRRGTSTCWASPSCAGARSPSLNATGIRSRSSRSRCADAVAEWRRRRQDTEDRAGSHRLSAAFALLTINPKAGAGDAPLTPRTVTVIGVSKDVAGFRITDVREAGLFLPTTVDAPKTFLLARVRGDADLARQTLLERLTRIDPNMGKIITLRTVARLETFF